MTPLSALPLPPREQDGSELTPAHGPMASPCPLSPALVPSCCFAAAVPRFAPRGLGGPRIFLIFHPLRAAVPCLRTQHSCCCCHCRGGQTALSVASVPTEPPRGGREQASYTPHHQELGNIAPAPSPSLGDARDPGSCWLLPETKPVLCRLGNEPYTAASLCMNVLMLAA